MHFTNGNEVKIKEKRTKKIMKNMMGKGKV